MYVNAHAIGQHYFERNSSLEYHHLVWKRKTKHTGGRIIRPRTVNYSTVSLTTDLPEAEQQSHHQNLPPLPQVSVFWLGPPRHQQTCPIFGQQSLLYLKTHHLHFDPSTNPQSQSHLGHYHCCCCLSQLLCYHPGEVLPQAFPHYLLLRKNVDQRAFFQWNFSSHTQCPPLATQCKIKSLVNIFHGNTELTLGTIYSYVGYNGAEHKIQTNSPNETLKGQESQLAGDQPTDYLQALPRIWTSGLQDTTPGSEWGHPLNKGLPEC